MRYQLAISVNFEKVFRHISYTYQEFSKGLNISRNGGVKFSVGRGKLLGKLKGKHIFELCRSLAAM